MDWLIKDISTILKSWGHAGGAGCELIIKSDVEPAFLAVRGAAMKYHGAIIIPESPAKGKKAANGLIEEAGNTIRELVCTFLSQMGGNVGEVTVRMTRAFVDCNMGSHMLLEVCGW